MFRSIQTKVSKRLETLKQNTQADDRLTKLIRAFLIQEFGPVGESLTFKASQEKKKLHLYLESKTAANEVVLRSRALKEILRVNKISIESIVVQ